MTRCTDSRHLNGAAESSEQNEIAWDIPITREEALLALVAAVCTAFVSPVALRDVRRAARALVPGVSDSELQSALSAAQRHPQPQQQHGMALAGAPASPSPGACVMPPLQRSRHLDSREVLARRVFAVSVSRVLQQPWLQRRAGAEAGGSGASGSGAGPSSHSHTHSQQQHEEDIAAAWSQLSEAQRHGFIAAVGPGLARLAARQQALGRPLSETELVAELEGFVVAPDPDQGQVQGQQQDQEEGADGGEEEEGQGRQQGRGDEASPSSSSDSSDDSDSDSDSDSSDDSGRPSEGEGQEGKAAKRAVSGQRQGQEKRQQLEPRSLLQLLTATPPEEVGT